MNIHSAFTALLVSLLLTGCGSDKPASKTTAATSTEIAEAADKGEVVHQMPDSDQLEEAYDAILEKAGVSDPELLEIYVSFSKSVTNPESERAHMSMQMVSPQSKNKIVQYQYDFGKKEIEGPQPVTLSSGLGAKEEFIDTYDGFKDSLFKKSEIMDFDEADKVYKKAIAISGYEPKDCYVDNLQFKYSPRVGLKGIVDVQSTRSSGASRHYSVDKAGTVINE